MADLILPAVQLSADAWRNIAASLRDDGDAHCVACADEIGRQIDRIDGHFKDMAGEVTFAVHATLKAG